MCSHVFSGSVASLKICQLEKFQTPHHKTKHSSTSETPKDKVPKAWPDDDGLIVIPFILYRTAYSVPRFKTEIQVLDASAAKPRTMLQLATGSRILRI